MKKYLIGGGILVLAAIAGLIFFFTKMAVQMQVDKAVQIHINDKVPLEASIDSNVIIALINDLQTQIKVNDKLKIKLDEEFNVPLKMDLTVPLNTEVYMDQVLDLKFDLPVDINLDQTEMPLKNLVIPFNKKLHINDSLAVDIVIPLETKIKTNFKGFFNFSLPIKTSIPLKTMIPVDQPLQVNDTLVLSMQDYNIPLKTTIPVEAKVPVKQLVKIQGELNVPVNQTVTISLAKIISAPVTEPFTATVKATNDLEASFKSKLRTDATFSKPLRVVQMDSLRIEPSKVKFIMQDK